jgi:hypothetical protein
MRLLAPFVVDGASPRETRPATGRTLVADGAQSLMTSPLPTGEAGRV